MRISIGSFAIILSMSSVLVAGNGEKAPLTITWDENSFLLSVPRNTGKAKNKQLMVKWEDDSLGFSVPRNEGKGENKQLIVPWEEYSLPSSAPRNKYIMPKSGKKRPADQMNTDINKENTVVVRNKRYRPAPPSESPSIAPLSTQYLPQKLDIQTGIPQTRIPIPNLHVPYLPKPGEKRSADQMNTDTNKENTLEVKNKRYRPAPPSESPSIAPLSTQNLPQKLEIQTGIPQTRVPIPNLHVPYIPRTPSTNDQVDFEKLKDKFFAFEQQFESKAATWQTVRLVSEREKKFLLRNGINLDLFTEEQYVRFSQIKRLDLEGRNKDVLYYQKATYLIMNGATIQATASLLEPTSKTARKDLIVEINFLINNGILTQEEQWRCL